MCGVRIPGAIRFVFSRGVYPYYFSFLLYAFFYLPDVGRLILYGPMNRKASEIMKIYRLVLLFLFAVTMLSCGDAPQTPESCAREVIERTLGRRAPDVELRLTEKAPDGHDRFATRVTDGRLVIEGSSGVALTRGFYDYITTNGYGQVTWTGTRMELPERLPDTPLREVSSPFRHHYYMNVCTFGYTYPYWSWNEWEKELDWMALHGFDMALAPIGSEAILMRVWRDMGLTEEEINELFTAPGHLPWMRMGNMSGLDSPLSERWLDEQVALQHRILDRMRGLGITPVFSGFAGFVPPAIARVRPGVTLTETRWNDHMKSWMLPVESPLFREIAARYMEEWEREFGRGEYYLVDSFNEMELPFGELSPGEVHAQLTRYGETVYKSIAAVNPDAVWVLQGWMFGYQRDIWTPDNIRALLAGVPDDKLLVVDLAEDFNAMVWRNAPGWEYADGFAGKQWIYSTVPNFGGRSALSGSLEFYANGHLAALQSARKGNLVGYGTAPEGVENNDVVYEMIADAGWSSEPIDVEQWVRRYARNRYGDCPGELGLFWDHILRSSYSVSVPNQARYRWQMTPYDQRRGPVDISDDFFRAVEHFAAAGPELSGSGLYRADLALYAALYAAGKADIAVERANAAYLAGDPEAAAAERDAFFSLLLTADRLLESTPNHRLERWLGFAEARGHSDAEKERYQRDARRLITCWSDGASLHDYACRVWSGLIRDYIVPRWEHYFDCKERGTAPDFAGLDSVWLASAAEPLSPQERCPDVLTAAEELFARYGAYGSDFVRPESRGIVGSWSPFEFGGSRRRIRLTLDPATVPGIRGVRFRVLRGGDGVRVGNPVLQVDRVNIASTQCEAEMGPVHAEAVIPIRHTQRTVPAEAALFVTLDGPAAADSFGVIELVR